MDPTWQSGLSVHPDDFGTQCAWIARRRRVLPLAEAVGRLDRRGQPPRGTAVLTFDDGFACNYHHAWPVLRRHRLPATVFLVAQTLTTQGHPVDWVDDPPSHPLQTLTRDQVLEMQEGGVDFGSHSLEHRVLTELSDAECLDDLRTSRELLEALLGRPVPILAYPRGRHDERVRRSAERAGYSHALALPEGPERPGPYAIPRVGIFGHNKMPTVRAKMIRGYLPLRNSQVVPLVRRAVGRGGGTSAC